MPLFAELERTTAYLSAATGLIVLLCQPDSQEAYGVTPNFLWEVYNTGAIQVAPCAAVRGVQGSRAANITALPVKSCSKLVPVWTLPLRTPPQSGCLL